MSNFNTLKLSAPKKRFCLQTDTKPTIQTNNMLYLKIFPKNQHTNKHKYVILHHSFKKIHFMKQASKTIFFLTEPILNLK